jgi:hypothetical protein
MALPGQATAWGTPTARDYKDGVNPSEKAPTASRLGRQAPRSLISGDASSRNDPNSRLRLNPLFDEWLMALPIGWTDFAPLGMESYPWLQQWRFYIYSRGYAKMPNNAEGAVDDGSVRA